MCSRKEIFISFHPIKAITALGSLQLTSSAKDNDDDPAAVDWDSDLWLGRLPGDSPSLASSAGPASISPASSGPVEESSCSFCSSRICRLNAETKKGRISYWPNTSYSCSIQIDVTRPVNSLTLLSSFLA